LVNPRPDQGSASTCPLFNPGIVEIFGLLPEWLTPPFPAFLFPAMFLN
jgi:hypothetical protein